MAAVSPLPAIGISGVMALRDGIVAEPPRRVIENTIYVALGKEVKESKTTLLWALHNSGGKKICILHVHQPAQMIPLMGTRFAASQLEEHQVRGFREIERQNMHKLLEEYSRICERAGVRAEILHTEMDSIEKGIIELISEHDIRKLVMGAAADKHYSK